MKRALSIRVSIYAVCVLAGLTVVVGLLHTPAGRPLLALLGVGCPMKVSPEAVEAARLDGFNRITFTTQQPTR